MLPWGKSLDVFLLQIYFSDQCFYINILTMYPVILLCVIEVFKQCPRENVSFHSISSHVKGLISILDCKGKYICSYTLRKNVLQLTENVRVSETLVYRDPQMAWHHFFNRHQCQIWLITFLWNLSSHLGWFTIQYLIQPTLYQSVAHEPHEVPLKRTFIIYMHISTENPVIIVCCVV